MSKHTPGPWEYMGLVKVEGIEGWTIKCADNRYIRCEGRNAEEADANARLIAAAPELLEALKALIDTSQSTPTEWVRACSNAAAAIAKAEGQS